MSSGDDDIQLVKWGPGPRARGGPRSTEVNGAGTYRETAPK